MANRTATLYIRITKNGRSSFRKPVYQSKGRLKPQYAMVNGEPEHHKEGVYYLRFGTDGGKQRFVLVGKDPYVALDKLGEKQRWLRDQERHVAPQKPVTSKPESSRTSIDEGVEQYFRNLEPQGKDRKTIRAYRVAIDEFRQSCTKKFVDEIRKQDLIDFMGWLRKQSPKLRKDGTPRRPRSSGDPNRYCTLCKMRRVMSPLTGISCMGERTSVLQTAPPSIPASCYRHRRSDCHRVGSSLRAGLLACPSTSAFHGAL